MNRFDLLILWMRGQVHLLRRGHLPQWFQFDRRAICLNCSTSGGGPRDGQQRRLVLAPRPL